MSKCKVEEIRNVALVGHGACGKTTLADLILHRAGVGSRAGSVDEGTSLLDTDDEEKEHKHSTSSAAFHFEQAGRWINAIDTPGYPDFIGQAIGAMRAVETVVVTVSAGSGVEVNTRRVFQQAGAAGDARIILVNKCDVENIDLDGLLAEIEDNFGAACVPLNVPVGIGSEFSGVVSTLNVPDSIPDGVQLDPSQINQKLLDAVVESDEALMERYFEGETLSPEEVAGAVTKAMAAGTLIPIFFASAKMDVGVEELMAALSDYALSPVDRQRVSLDDEDAESPLEQQPDSPLVAQVFKTRIDPFVSKMSYLRIYAGSVKKDTSVKNHRTGNSLKIGQLLEVQGGQQNPVDEAYAGDIVALTKMDDLQVGDTITVDANGSHLPEIPFPTPMVGLAVEPKTSSDQQKISGALHKIEEEDQTFHVSRESQTKEMVIQGMSELHLQIVIDRLLKRDKVGVLTHQPKVPYRETISGEAEGRYRHKKQSGGSGQFAEVHFRMSPMPHGVDSEEYFTKARFESMRRYEYDPVLNSAFVDRISGGSIPNNFIPAIEKGVRERMAQGVLAGCIVQDVVVELFFGKDHPVDSNETAFKIAASKCFQEIFLKAKPVMLEPIVHAVITAPGDKLGDISSDLSGRRGQLEGITGAAGGFQDIEARVPLAEMMTYARSLSSMTSGQGSFSMELVDYAVMPPNEQQKAIAAAKPNAAEED
ncbi:MAG: GTP-binding protein [Planctomycetaceae bacterium]|nr:GTP-binding protein [Planctomycetaceae bacterium]